MTQHLAKYPGAVASHGPEAKNGFGRRLDDILGRLGVARARFASMMAMATAAVMPMGGARMRVLGSRGGGMILPVRSGVRGRHGAGRKCKEADLKESRCKC